MGNLFGRRSGDIAQSLEAGEVGGENFTGFRDEARGGRLAVWYIFGVSFGGDSCGDVLAGVFCFAVGVGVGVCGLAEITLGAGLTGVIGSGWESGIWEGLSGAVVCGSSSGVFTLTGSVKLDTSFKALRGEDFGIWGGGYIGKRRCVSQFCILRIFSALRRSSAADAFAETWTGH